MRTPYHSKNDIRTNTIYKIYTYLSIPSTNVQRNATKAQCISLLVNAQPNIPHHAPRNTPHLLSVNSLAIPLLFLFHLVSSPSHSLTNPFPEKTNLAISLSWCRSCPVLSCSVLPCFVLFCSALSCCPVFCFSFYVALPPFLTHVVIAYPFPYHILNL